MTPIRKRESLQAELTGLEGLFSLTPDDPVATPLLKSRIVELYEEIQKLEKNPPLSPETEIFFSAGPVIGSRGIEATFAGQVIRKFQDMVSNHYAAKFCGALRRMGRRRGEADSTLFLTALPTGSFGLQLSQPHVTDFITAARLTETMEDVTVLVRAAAADDQSFLDTISNFNGRVLVPLTKFLEVLNNAGADCRLLSGRIETTLKKENVAQAYQRVQAAKEDFTTTRLSGLFCGVLTQSGRFEFIPDGQNLMTGWLGDEVSEEQASEWDRQLTGGQCEAEIRVTTVSTQTGKRSCTNELINLRSLR